MVRKAVGQVSLVEALLPAAFGSNLRLERVRAQVDWALIEATLQPMRLASTGRPAYPPLVQIKVLLLQQWYRLSDRDLEEDLADRLSFRRFCGLGLEDAVPDATTLSRFDLAEAGPGGSGVRRAERATRTARPRHQGGHADRCDLGRG
ncbi:MAG TPA: transposase [Geminicoccus sp.]|uniref:transposase n=1 Tax=Geminicoccus sp. TaxID=2024832 RepID=UPI002E33E466|nr:transposase [Geminicoccus sp.]HEX2525947.1 transposase [Geminicoccus sp.]